MLLSRSSARVVPATTCCFHPIPITLTSYQGMWYVLQG
jgi:hypothetical protein